MSDDSILKSITVACPDCDLINKVPALAPDESASCVRCDATLSRNPVNSIERGIALTFTAIVLFSIANFFPFLSFGDGAIVTHTKLVSGVVGLYREDMVILAAVVGFTTVIAPIVILSGSCYLLLPLQRGYKFPGAAFVYKVLMTLRDWNMIEIFMIGIIVAAVKLYKMASLIPGISAWSLIILVFVLVWLYQCLDPRQVWERLASARTVHLL
jgi:paraquat-inducible protein A